MRGEDDLSIVSAYFSIYGYEVLKDKLNSIKKLRFLFGDPSSFESVDPEEKELNHFLITETGLEPAEQLTQKSLAKECAEWLRKKAQVKSINSNFLHGKMYHINNGEKTVALSGSSNFTQSGLGNGKRPNIEINVSISDVNDIKSLKTWFDEIWDNKLLVQDVKKRVLSKLEKLYEDQTPEFIYFKTLFNIFKETIEERKTQDISFKKVHLYDSKIWEKLYEFQKEGAKGVINKLWNYDGCILADSVELGKTYTALAVIKYFELRNENVLVLCPKKLYENWNVYRAVANNRNNPFPRDRFGYSLLAHTDLGRKTGKSGEVDLANFNWGNFDLVVIDESHNFRNMPRDRKDEDGNIIKRSRYNQLIEEVIKKGSRTKVLMLSATPVNTSLTDLRNQIELMTEADDRFFRDSIKIASLKRLLNESQKQFKEWESMPNRNKSYLLEKLGAGFLRLLDGVSIARSRNHIKRHYADVIEKIGGFPQHKPPVNEYPSTDTEGILSYEDLNTSIQEFSLSIYLPSKYLLDKTELIKEKEKFNLNQEERENFLIGMMRVNMMKRLESSAHALQLTLSRTIEKAENVIEMINRYDQNIDEQVAMDSTTPINDEEDDDFVVGKRKEYKLNQLDVERWKTDLENDIDVLKKAYSQAVQINTERDNKLKKLREVLEVAMQSPVTDKDGRSIRKVLIFTAFADTANYLYKNLEKWAEEKQVNIALVTGTGRNKTGLGRTDFQEILTNFAPIARSRVQENGDEENDEIDILIATDCISEGQNLQDCPIVVNYDIHWNPVRLMQRFGRIDRIGSRHTSIQMVNFWPTDDLNRYINLTSRVEARMALMNATATGEDDILISENDLRDKSLQDLNFRDEQIKNLRNSGVDSLENTDNIELSDFTLDDFLVELLSYLEKNKNALQNSPNGLFAVVSSNKTSDCIKPGVIFCLRQKDSPEESQSPNPTDPYFLAYVRDNGDVRYFYAQAKHILGMFGEICRNNNKPDKSLCELFDRETNNGKEMNHYNNLLDKMITNLKKHLKKHVIEDIRTTGRDAIIPSNSEMPHSFELVTWLVIRDKS